MFRSAIAAVIVLSAPSAWADCTMDRVALMAMPVDAFDSQPQGWRSVAHQQGCELTAADVIAEYRTANAGTLVNGPPQDIASLNWHEGQLRASNGQTDRAAALMDNSRVTFSAADALYAQATLAFLRRDRAALQSARDELAALPKPPGFDEGAARFRAQFGQTITWPSNLDFVDAFLRCYDRPYQEAYDRRCGLSTR